MFTYYLDLALGSSRLTSLRVSQRRPKIGVRRITLWLIGQLAVLGPALRAAAVPPVVATRSV